MISFAVITIFPLCLAFAAWMDLFTMTIPNRISLIIAGAFIVMAPLVGLPISAIGMHFLAAAIVFAICFALFALNIMGGGDVKLLAVSTLWFGFDPSLLSFMVYTAFLGGVLTVIIVVLRTSDLVTTIGIPLPKTFLNKNKVPYGIAIAIGGFLAYPSSPIMMALLNQVV